MGPASGKVACCFAIHGEALRAAVINQPRLLCETPGDYLQVVATISGLRSCENIINRHRYSTWLHALAIQNAVHQQQGLNKLADAVFLRWAPGNPGVLGTCLVQDQEIRVKRHNHALLRGREGELILIGQSAAIAFLGR